MIVAWPLTPMRRRLAGATALTAALGLAGLVVASATSRPTGTVVKQTSFKVNREGGAYPQAAFAGLSPEGGTVSVTQKFGATPSTATFKWVLPKEIPAAGAKGSLTISVTVPADSERYAPAMAIDSAMLDCTGVKVGAGGSCSTGGRVQVGGVAEKGESKTFTQEFKLRGSAADVTVGIQDGPNITYSYAVGQATAKPGDCATYKTRMLRSARRAQAINELRVVCVEPDVAVHREGSADESWDPVEVGTILKQGDEISCDPDGIAVVAFADNSTFTLKHAAMLKIASFFTQGGVVRLEVLLKMGEVAATINKSEATKSDFQIKQPTATASVRGTIFSVFYDPVSKSSITSVKRGVVEVDPAKPGLKTVNVAAGKEVQVTPTTISPVAAVRKSGSNRRDQQRQGARPRDGEDRREQRVLRSRAAPDRRLLGEAGRLHLARIGQGDRRQSEGLVGVAGRRFEGDAGQRTREEDRRGLRLSPYLRLPDDHALDPAVGDDPDERDQDEKRDRDPRNDEGERKRGDIERERELALPIATDRLSELRVVLVQGEQTARQQRVRDRASEQHDHIRGDRPLLDTCLAEPGRRDGRQREPEEQMDVRPERPAVDPVHDLHQVVVVHPVDRDEDEAQQVDEELALLVQDVGELVPRRRPQLEDEDRDQNRDDAVREGVHPVGLHGATMPPPPAAPASLMRPRPERDEMRSFTLDSFESSPHLRDDLPRPEPGDGELLVRVHASSVNPADAALASGMLKGMIEYEFPVTLGRDFAGVVESVGSSVTRYQPGNEVYGFLPLANPAAHDGSWADYAVVTEATSVALKPSSVDFVTAGAAPIAALTAIAAVDALELGAGTTVLVVGATGGVGNLFVQLAAAAGADVFATGLPDDREFLLGLGASEIVDRNTDVGAHVRETYPDGVDALLDLVTYQPDASVLKPGGLLASPVGAAGDGPGRFNLMASATKPNLDRLAALLDSGALRVPIQHSYALEQAGDALEALTTTHTQGKLAITIA